MKPKKYEEVKYIALENKAVDEIKRDYKVMTIFMAVLIILTLIISFKAWILAIDYEALMQEKEALEETVTMQNSMISDLEENCKDLFIEIESLKFGGNAK